MIAISNRKLCKKNLADQLVLLAKSGIKAIQIREKDLPAAELLKLAQKVSSSIDKYKTKIIVNDRLDIALLSNAGGLHSPANGISIKDIRGFTKNMISGKSVHSLKEAVEAEKAGYDYLIFGPIYRTPAKVKYGKPQGINNLKEICSKVKIPVFAVGGINPNRIKKCLKAGAYGVAAIREFMQSGNPEKTVREFMNELPEN